MTNPQKEIELLANDIEIVHGIDKKIALDMIKILIKYGYRMVKPTARPERTYDDVLLDAAIQTYKEVNKSSKVSEIGATVLSKPAPENPGNPGKNTASSGHDKRCKTNFLDKDGLPYLPEDCTCEPKIDRNVKSTYQIWSDAVKPAPESGRLEEVKDWVALYLNCAKYWNPLNDKEFNAKLFYKDFCEVVEYGHTGKD